MTECQCAACQDLRRECGSHYAWLSRKLLAHGWAGKMSPAEKAYRRAHSAPRPPLSERQMAVRATFGRGMPSKAEAISPSVPEGTGEDAP
jgi:hypothetical protein